MHRKSRDIVLKVLFLVLSFLGSLSLWGQVDVGINAPGVKWQYVETPQYQIIFPPARAADAQRVAGLLDHITRHDSLAIGVDPHPVPIILQNQTVIPNGFVSLGPWRSELQLNPPQFQFAGVAPWLDLLTIHEYRHVQQISEARKGFGGKFLRTFFGQGGWAFNSGAIQPRWFLEGDAVFAETMYTQGGRGRTPAFENQYRALRLSGQRYDYEKASFWSYKDFIPNHYHLGYHMTTHARRAEGVDVWDKVLQETYSKIGLYRFSKALRQETGLNTKHLYYRTMEELDSIWQAQDQRITPLEGTLVSKAPKNTYTNYRYPNYRTPDQVIVLKTSLNQISTAYQIDKSSGEEKRLFEPGLGGGEHLSVGADKVVWSEFRFHPRWFGQSYSIIMAYDFKTGAKQKITSQSKLFAPAISQEGKLIAAVSVEADGRNSLVVLDVALGTEVVRIPAEPGVFLSFPKWHEDQKQVFVAARSVQGNFIQVFDIGQETSQQVSPTFTATVDRLMPAGKFVYFSSSLLGVQNIFALNNSTGEVFQLTETRFGAFDPSVSADGKLLLYSEYTAQGYETRELVLQQARWRQSEFQEKVGANYYEPLLASNPGDITNQTLPLQAEFNPKKFKHLTKGLFNVHSWYPFVTTEALGVAVLTKNIMSSLAVTGQFNYNFDEKSWQTGALLSYGAFFPIIDVDVTTGERQTDNLVLTTDTLSIIGYRGGWQEHTVGAGIRIPINLTAGNYFTNLTLSPKYRLFVVDYFDRFTDAIRDENFGSLDLSLNFNRVQTAALQNILPRFAQTLAIQYNTTFDGSANQGERFTVDAAVVFPGLVRNHSLFFTGSYQKEDLVDAYRFADIFVDARGYGSGLFENIYRVSANYTLPLWYPDVSAGSIAYFKRLRANLFYDYSEGEVLGSSTLRRSLGVELITDFRLIRLVDVGVGVRLGYQTDRDRNFIELVISSISF